MSLLVKAPFLLGASAIVIAHDASRAVKDTAIQAKQLWGDLVQICNGVDDQVEIQAAINASSGDIYFSEGTFVKGNIPGITIPSNRCLRLSEGTTITFKTDVGDGAVIFENSDPVASNKNIAIVGGVLDGNRDNQAVGTQSAIKFDRVRTSSVDCHIRNFNDRNLWEVRQYYGVEYKNRDYPYTLNADNFQSIIASHPLVKLLDDFEADWTQISGTIEYDTAIKHSGTRSMKITTTVGGEGKADKAVSLDLSKAGFGVWVYIEDYTKIHHAYFYIKSAGAWTDWARGELIRVDQCPKINGKWIRLDMPYFDQITGSPDYSNIDTVRLQFNAEAGETAIVYVDELCYAKKVLTEGGVVSFYFDDSVASAYTKAKPLFDKYGDAASWGMVTANYPLNGTLLEQAKEAQECGWDIVGHTRTHAYTPDCYAHWEDEALGCQSDLIEAGFSKGAQFYIVPDATLSKEHLEVLERNFTLISSVGTQRHSLLLPLASAQNAWGMVATHSVDTIKGFIDVAKKESTWVNLVFHDIVDAGATGMDYNKADLEAIIDYCHTVGVPIMTFSGVYNNLRVPIVQARHSDLFMDCVDASLVYVHALAAADAAKHTDITPPDIPRSLNYTIKNNTGGVASGNACTVTFTGVDARGESIIDTVSFTAADLADLANGDSVTKQTKKAFATLGKVQSDTAQPENWQFSAGMSNLFGLSNAIYATGDVYKVKKNNADVGIGTVDVINSTVHCAITAGGDDFTIYYKSYLNIVS